MQIKKDFEAVLKEVIEKCQVCAKYKKAPPKPVVGLPLATRFNEVVACDLGELEGRKFLLMIDVATNYAQAVWIQDKKPKHVTEQLIEKWISVFGAPGKILSDNGLEFQNEKFRGAIRHRNIEHSRF